VPSQPALANQEFGGALEDSDEVDLVRLEWADMLVSRKSRPTGGVVLVQPFAGEPRQVARHGVYGHRTEIDQAGQAVVLEQEMLGARIPQAWLEAKNESGCPSEWRDETRSNATSQMQPSMCSVDIVGIKRGRTLDRSRERIDSTVYQA
jgi:hypothetical protein